MKFNTVIICAFICAFSLTSKGQTTDVAKNEKDKSVKQESSVEKATVIEQGNTKVKNNLNFNEGTIPTPEDQGFTKQTIDGKDTYVKEEGLLIIQYTPKK